MRGFIYSIIVLKMTRKSAQKKVKRLNTLSLGATSGFTNENAAELMVS